MQKAKSQSDWKRKLTHQEKTICRKVKEQITKKQKTKGLTTDELMFLLNGRDNFFGCYAEDQLSNITITGFPAYLIVNLDSSNLPGSHWITIRISRRTVEVFDPAGFEIFNWSRIPCTLLEFLHRQTVSRKIILSPSLQPQKSTLCGYYCIFYILLRAHYTLSTITSYFSPSLSQNDRRLKKFF